MYTPLRKSNNVLRSGCALLGPFNVTEAGSASPALKAIDFCVCRQSQVQTTGAGPTPGLLQGARTHIHTHTHAHTHAAQASGAPLS